MDDQVLSKKKEKKKRKRVNNYSKYGYLFIAPFFIVYLIFSLYPLLNTFYCSLFTYTVRNLKTITVFSGLDNYKSILGLKNGESAYFLKYLGNTFRIWLVNFVPQILLSLLVAAWLTDDRVKLKGKGLYKILVYMPNIMTAASISMLFAALLAKTGPIMTMLSNWGWISSTTDIMESVWGTSLSISFILFWMWYGNTTLLLIAGMIGINPSLYEAADLDGANSRQKFFGVTLPLLKPVLLYVLVTSVIGGLQLYDIPALFNVTTAGSMGLPADSSTTVTMYIMRLTQTSKDLGRASAVSVLLFLITLAISLLFFFGFSKSDSYKKARRMHQQEKEKKKEEKQSRKDGEIH